MATHSSTLARKIPWTKEPGRLQSMGSLRVRHDWVTSLSLFLSCTGEGNGNPLQCSCLENPRDRGAWWAAVYGVAQSRTRLKRLSSSSSSSSGINTFKKKLIWMSAKKPQFSLHKLKNSYPNCKKLLTRSNLYIIGWKKPYSDKWLKTFLRFHQQATFTNSGTETYQEIHK